MVRPRPRRAVSSRPSRGAPGARFVTVRLIHPARNRLPRDFIA